MLKNTTDSYNATYQRSIKKAPKSVTKNDETRLWKLNYSPRPRKTKRGLRYKFRVGDTVRISAVRRPFDREYDDERWTNEHFNRDHEG